MAYIYILHFDEPLAHASHYAGCTQQLKQRLIRHANGGGSTLTRVLMERGIGWTLGAVAECTKKHMRTLERGLKDLHNTRHYCETCCMAEGIEPKRIPGTMPYPISMIPWSSNSDELLKGQPLLPPTNIQTRFTGPDEPREVQLWIKSLMQKDKDALGFIPAGGTEGLNQLHDKGQIAIVSNNGQDVGYAFFTLTADQHKMTIHQCCIADEARLLGHGAALINTIIQSRDVAAIVAKVRSDLAANHFWNAVGFKEVGSFLHKTSGKQINQYLLLKGSSKHEL